MHTISKNATATIHDISREVSEAVETVASVSQTMIGIVIFRASGKLSRVFFARCRSADLWKKECAWISSRFGSNQIIACASKLVAKSGLLETTFSHLSVAVSRSPLSRSATAGASIMKIFDEINIFQNNDQFQLDNARTQSHN